MAISSFRIHRTHHSSFVSAPLTDPFLCLNLCRPPALWRGDFPQTRSLSAVLLHPPRYREAFHISNHCRYQANSLSSKSSSLGFLPEITKNPNNPIITKVITANPVSIAPLAPSRLSITNVDSPLST